MLPIGMDGGPVPVAHLKKGTWSIQGDPELDIAPQNKITFPDDSTAYFREFHSGMTRLLVPYSHFVLHEKGASELGKLLGLRVVPNTELACICRRHGKDRIASLQEGIVGTDFEKMSPQQLQKATKSFNQIIELYLYTVIAYDTDKKESNIFFNEATNRLFSIDNEYSGPEQTQFPLKFPPALEAAIVNKPIPLGYLDRLRQFINHRSKHTAKLLPYYSPKAINGMFQRAEMLLNAGRVIPLSEIPLKLRKSEGPIAGKPPSSQPSALRILA
jgi:hypothetical protein